MKKIISIITFIVLAYSTSNAQNYLLESGENAFGIAGSYASHDGFNAIGAGANYTLNGKWSFYLAQGFGWHDEEELEDFNSLASAVAVSYLILKQDDGKPFNLGVGASIELNSFPNAEIDLFAATFAFGAEAYYNIKASSSVMITPLVTANYASTTFVVEDESDSDSQNIYQIGCNFLFNKFYLEPRFNFIEDSNYLSFGIGYVFK